MNLHIMKKALLIGCLTLLFSPADADTKAAIYVTVNASAKVRLAAHEICRYFYLVTGTLPEFRTGRPGENLPDVSIMLAPSGSTLSVRDE